MIYVDKWNILSFPFNNKFTLNEKLYLNYGLDISITNQAYGNSKTKKISFHSIVSSSNQHSKNKIVNAYQIDKKT